MSTLNVSNITDGTTTVGTSYVVNGSAKVHANVTTSNTIRVSMNLSSIADEGTGRIEYNFTSAFRSAWYSYAALNKDGGGYNDDAGANSSDSDTSTASQFHVFTHHNGSANDSDGGVGLIICGDLA